MAKAEAAMRAVSPAAARLQFDRPIGELLTPYSTVLYSVPNVQPNPPVWSDLYNVPGQYPSGQAVCDARRAYINWATPLVYVETAPLWGNGSQSSIRGWAQCQDRVSPSSILGWPQGWLSCPSGYNPPRYTGDISPPMSSEPNMFCGNPLTVTIAVLPTAVCPIEPLTPLPSKATDPDTYAFEYEGKQVDVSRLNAEMKAALVCLTQKTGKAASSYVSSAWRPPAYQAHFKEVWEKWQLLKELEGAELMACQSLFAEVKGEVNKHGIAHLETSPAGRNGLHTRGAAFDVNSWFIPSVDTFSADCKVYRNLKKKDKVHVIHR